jgi:tRNA (cytidine56-2'-O)-methyltransferase
MEIDVLRIGQRVVRDDRVTTHVALVARSFGAKRIYMNEINPEIKHTISKINKTWGGNFTIENVTEWKKIIKEKKNASVKIVHLTMYGQNINNVENKIRSEDKILIIVGAEKVPGDIYHMADYNVAIGNQPHSEISALGVLLDRIQHGKQLESKFENPERVVIPQEQGKKVRMNKTNVNNGI